MRDVRNQISVTRQVESAGSNDGTSTSSRPCRRASTKIRRPCACAARRLRHPFATLKMRMGVITHFLCKTLPKVATEMALNVLGYNLTRVMNMSASTALVAAVRA